MVLDVRLEDVERRITDALEQLSAKSCSQAVRPRHGTESGSEDMGATSRHEEDGNDAASAPEDIPTSESGLTPPDCVCDTLATAYRRGPKRRYYFDLVAQHIIGKRGRDPLRDDDYAELPADFFPAVDVPSRALELLGGLLVSYESIADVFASEWKYAVAAHGLYRKGADASAVILRVESTYVRSGQDVEIVIARGADGGWLVREDGICREKSLLSPHGQLDNFAFWPLWNRDPNDPDKHVPRRDGDLATLARSIRAEGWAPVNPADNESGSAYDLESVDSVELNDADIRNGRASVINNYVSSEDHGTSYTASNSTVFVDADNNRVWTGYNEVTSKSSVEGALVLDGSVIEIVFISSSANSAAEADDYVYIADIGYETTTVDGDTVYIFDDAYINGEQVDLYTDSGARSTITRNGEGLYVIDEYDGTNEDWATQISPVVPIEDGADVGVDTTSHAVYASNGVLELYSEDTNMVSGNSSKTFSYDSNTVFMVVELKGDNNDTDDVYYRGNVRPGRGGRLRRHPAGRAGPGPDAQ